MGLSEEFLVWHNDVPLIVVSDDTEFESWLNAVPFEDQQSIGARSIYGNETTFTNLSGALSATSAQGGKCITYTTFSATIRAGHRVAMTGKSVSYSTFSALIGHRHALHGRVANRIVFNVSPARKIARTIKFTSRTRLTGRLVAKGRMAGRSRNFSRLRYQIPLPPEFFTETPEPPETLPERNQSMLAENIELIQPNRSPRARMRNINWGETTDDPDLRPLRPAEIGHFPGKPPFIKRKLQITTIR